MSNTEEPQTDRQESVPVLAVCGECRFLQAIEPESQEAAFNEGEDPAANHYHETGHNCGSFELEREDDFYEWWQTLMDSGDMSDVPPTEEIWRRINGETETEA